MNPAHQFPASERQHRPALGHIYEPHVDFDYSAVDGEPEPEEPNHEDLGLAIRRVLIWMLGVPNGHTGKIDIGAIGKRALALSWSLDPSIISGSPSLRRLAKDTRTSKSSLSRQTAQARREFGLANTYSGHAHNFKKAQQ